MLAWEELWAWVVWRELLSLHVKEAELGEMGQRWGPALPPSLCSCSRAMGMSKSSGQRAELAPNPVLGDNHSHEHLALCWTSCLHVCPSVLLYLAVSRPGYCGQRFSCLEIHKGG